MLLSAVLLTMQAAVGPTPPVPFAVGERIEYSGRMGFIRAGSAVLSVDSLAEMRGHQSWVFSFVTEVNLAVYRNRSEFTSWTGVDDFISRQFVKDVTENSRQRLETFRIYPDSGFYRRNQNTEVKTTPDLPLDDVAFFYWIRTLPLEMGHSYRFDRYFRHEHNPVIVRVEKRETKEMPDGTKVPVLLLRPVVNEDGGMFHEKSKAKLWITDDARRIPVEIETDIKLAGRLTLKLRSYTPAPGT